MGEGEHNACHRHLFPKALSRDLSGFDVSGRAYRGGMSALEDDRPRFLTCIVDDSWSAEEKKELVWAYEAGMSISLLASYLGYSAREVVQELSRQIFRIATPIEDKNAPRHGAKSRARRSGPASRHPVSAALPRNTGLLPRGRGNTLQWPSSSRRNRRIPQGCTKRCHKKLLRSCFR